MIKKVDKIIYGVANAYAAISYVLVIAIILLIAVDVSIRTFGGSGSIKGSYEIVERMLLVLVFAAYASTQARKGHVHVTMFLAKFPRIIRMPLFGILGLVSTAACFICAKALMEQTGFSLEAGTHTAILAIPLYPFFFVSSISMFLFSVVLLWDSFKSFVAIKNDAIEKEIVDVWN